MKPFDDQLADNVRKVFDAYDEEVSPQAWADMEARLERGGKSRVVPLWPFLARAAGLALLTGLSIFLYVNFEPGKVGKTLAEQVDVQKTPSHEPETALETLVAEQGSITPPVTPVASPSAQSKPGVNKYGQAQLQQGEALAIVVKETQDTVLTVLAEVQLPSPEVHSGPGAQTEEVQEVPTLALLPEEERTGRQSGRPSYVPSSEKEPGQGGPKEHRIAWGITAGSMLAFAERRVSDGPGYAAGVTAEYEISPNITLASGGSLTYHNFELVNFSQDDFAFEYLPNLSNDADVSLSGNNEYEMLALEVPINAQFNLMETSRRRLYVSTGLSSLVYLQQRFSGTNTAFVEQSFYDAATGSFQMQYSSSTFSVNEEYGPLSRFDFGRLVNLSFGYVMRRENHSLVVEPFVKLPLGRLTSRDISLGMGGLSLKYRFSGD